MTLAPLVCAGILWAATALPFTAIPSRALSRQDASQTRSDKTTTPAQSSQDQGSTAGQNQTAAPKPPATPDVTKPPSTQNGQTAPPAPRRRRKKKQVQANCNSATPTPATPSTSDSPSGSPASAPANTAPADPAVGIIALPSAANASANCPPTKVVVRHGGTAEPSIRLGGGAAGGVQTSHERDTTNQMLASTEQNLKKIAELKLTASQQDVVNHIRQFMEQSKSAAAAGDPDRARTLAWKAQLLSEDLLKPAQ
jgi:hypothetical protein